MRLRPEDIPASGLRVEFDLGPGGMAAEALAPGRLSDPLQARLFIEPVGEGVRVRGAVTGRLILACQRCLAETSRAIDLDVDVTLSPQPEEFPEEFQLDRGDLEAVYFDEEIDLDRVVLDQVELSLPMVYLCREDCPGICPGCGVDLSREACRCGEGPADPRWDKLKDWRPR